MDSTKKRPLCIVFISSHWGYKYGGINTVNYELCTHLGEYISNQNLDIKLVCIIPNNEYSADTTMSTCRIIQVGRGDSNEESVNPYEAFHKVKAQFGQGREIWIIGHDVITSTSTFNLLRIIKENNYDVKCALFHHMNYEAYTSKKDSEKAEGKITNQVNTFKNNNINLIFAVGPKLKRTIERVVTDRNIAREFIPGLNIIENENHNPINEFKIFVSGRLNKDDDVIKKSTLVLRAINKSSKINNCILTLFGVDEKPTENITNFEQNRITINLFKYSSEREIYIQQLKQSDLCIMPSYEEGFGLVAWEAIGLGIPILISKSSGVSELLCSILDDTLSNTTKEYVGRNSISITDDESSVELLHSGIVEVVNRKATFKDLAIALQEQLKERFNWESRAKSFLDELYSTSKPFPDCNETNCHQTKEPFEKVPETFKKNIGSLIEEYLSNQYKNKTYFYNEDLTFVENVKIICEDCDEVTSATMNKAREYAFNTKYGNYDYSDDARTVKGDYSWEHCIKQWITETKGKRVIAMGVNNGDELRDLFGDDSSGKLVMPKNLYGVDISTDAISRAKQKYEEYGVNFDVGDMESGVDADWYKKGELFDLYLNLRSANSRGVDLRNTIIECKKRLKNKGRVIFSVPNGYKISAENGTVQIETGMYNSDTRVLATDLPYQYVNKIRHKLEIHGFSEVGVFTGKSEIFITGIKNN